MKSLLRLVGRPHWIVLCTGAALTLAVSLSIHVVMLQVLHIPFPEFAGVSAWAAFCNLALAVLAMIVFYALAERSLRSFSIWTRGLIVFALYAMLKESFRGILMAGIVTDGWLFDIVQAIPSLLSALVLSSMVVVATPKLGGLWAKVAGAGAIASVSIFAVKPLIKIAFTPIIAWAVQFDHPEIHPFPYGWQVLIPAYITYSEPVLACMVMACLICPRLSPKPWTRGLQFSAIVLFMKGIVLPTFVYSFYSKSNLAPAMLSQSQFLLEAVALASLTALVWSKSFHAGRMTKVEESESISFATH